MKTPFPAVYFSKLSTAMAVWPCRVLTLFPSSEQALVEIPTLHGAKVVKMVSYAALASNRETATQKIAQAFAGLVETLPASANPETGKSATSSTAGAGAG